MGCEIFFEILFDDCEILMVCKALILEKNVLKVSLIDMMLKSKLNFQKL